jgi:serine protease Do
MNYGTVMTGRSGRTTTLLAAGLAIFGLTAAIIAAANVHGETPLKNPTPAVASAAEVGKAFTEVTRKTTPAVVFVNVEKKMTAGNRMPMQGLPEQFDDELLKKFFGDRLPQLQVPETPQFATGQGSGFIISEDGYILTNAHVVGGADRVTVTLADQREYTATIIGTDSHSDVAVVKIDAKNLPTLPLGDSEQLETGEWVLAIGSPFGLPGTVTSGIVSATGRNRVGITDYENFIQTDAAINPGNSGGPLVNLQGEVVGINTAIFSRSGGYMGIGFAIPVNMAREVCDQLIRNGSVTRGYLGIMIQELTPDLARSFGLEGKHGVLIGDVTHDSPAENAGLKSGDVVVGLDGQEVKDMGSFRNRVAHTQPEQKMALKVVRDGKQIDVSVTVGKLPAQDELAVSTNNDKGAITSLGMRVMPLNAELRQRYGMADDAKGVVIAEVEPGSKAMRAGLQAGTLVLSVNRQPIHNVEEFRNAIDAGVEKGVVLLQVKQGDFSRYVAIHLED